MSDGEPLDIERSALLVKMKGELDRLRERVEDLEEEQEDSQIIDDVYEVIEQSAGIENVAFKDGRIEFDLTDDRVVSIPLHWSWRLEGATPLQRQNYNITDDENRVVWPEVDEEITVQGILMGDPAPRPENE